MAQSRRPRSRAAIFGALFLWVVVMAVWYNGSLGRSFETIESKLSPITQSDGAASNKENTGSASNLGGTGTGNKGTTSSTGSGTSSSGSKGDAAADGAKAEYSNAHKLPTPDSFLPYFDKVLRARDLTMAEAKGACTWTKADKVNFQFGDEADWAVKDRSDKEITTHRELWKQFIREEKIPFSSVKNRFSGRGLVILAGNHESLPRVIIILRALQRLGSKIPVEFHYWDNEMNVTSKEHLASLYHTVYFNDLAAQHNIIQVQRDRFWVNYQLKTAAMVNSRFAEPLLLDSDNIPIIDPESLYSSKVYKDFGTVFWPDIARTRPSCPAWAITNTPCRMDEYEQESGQLLVDKTRFWYHLQLAAWMNNNEGFYYDKFLLGDKDTFRFAWHALKTEYGKPKKWLTSVGTENDGYYCGHSFAQHHPDTDQIAFLHGGLTKTVSLEVLKWNRETKGGYYRHYKQSKNDEQPNKIIDVGIKFDQAEYYPNHSPDFNFAQCTDVYDTKARDFEELLPGFEKLFEELGGYWRLDGMP